jgi:hypothetical protein
MIVPWSCHICSARFDKYDGGVCARCKKPTCLKHLKLVGYDKKQGAATPEQITCGECVRPEEKSRRFKKSLLSDKAWIRMLGIY